MVLVFNVYLTSAPANPSLHLDRGLLPNYSKADVAKYSLASLAEAYPWKRAIVNVEFESSTDEEMLELKEYVYSLFKGTDLVYNNRRCVYQEEWRDLCHLINDDLILYLGNHDHIFLDSDQNYLRSIVSSIQSSSIENPTIAISHWPENIRWAKSGYIELSELHPRRLNSNYKTTDLYASYEGVCIDSLIITTRNLFTEWLCEGDWSGIALPRTEGIGQHNLSTIKSLLGSSLPNQTIIVPYKELFRHFDGYMHQRISNNYCPSLTIPDGFFDNKIKIRYGYDDYKEGWVNINPTKQSYRACTVDGVDYKITLEDLPLVWKSRILTVDVNENIQEDVMVQHRLHAVLQMMYSDQRYNPYIDSDVENAVMHTYLKNYKKYKLL
jgi:hypothetical protein